jgi:hypothetical protein
MVLSAVAGVFPTIYSLRLTPNINIHPWDKIPHNRVMVKRKGYIMHFQYDEELLALTGGFSVMW